MRTTCSLPLAARSSKNQVNKLLLRSQRAARRVIGLVRNLSRPVFQYFLLAINSFLDAVFQFIHLALGVVWATRLSLEVDNRVRYGKKGVMANGIFSRAEAR